MYSYMTLQELKFICNQVASFSGFTLIIIFRDLEEYIDDTLPTIGKTFEIPVNEFDGACKQMRSFLRSHAKLKRSTRMHGATRKTKFSYLLALARTYKTRIS